MPNLALLENRFPKAFYFRCSESVENFQTYDEWIHEFERLQGVQGKALAEEKSDRTVKHIRAYTAFKRAHPEQLLLLHFNGNARDPAFETGDFYAGHWLYTNGATVIDEVPDDVNGVCEVRVSNPALFKPWTGRYFDRGEDCGLCELDADGKPDWRRSEQVQIVAVHPERGSVSIRRGCHGTRPIGFPAGRTYLAPHLVEGPWNGPHNNLMWYYNYSTECPRDEQGRTCGDVLLDWLVHALSPSGPLAAYDGIEFDVLFSSMYNHPYRYLQDITADGTKSPDCDGDGIGEMGIRDGLDTYGLGVMEFCRRLRERLGPDRLIMADAGWWHGQRSFDHLNGIETEGMQLDADGHCAYGHMLNSHLHWHHRAQAPDFSYLKIHQRHGPASDAAWRVGMAVVTMAGSALAVTTRPGTNGTFGGPAGDRPDDWDELVGGGEEYGPGWLGAPTTELMRPALQQTPLVGGKAAALAERLRSDDATLHADGDALLITGTCGGRGNRATMTVHLDALTFDGPDLVITLRGRPDPIAGYPVEGQRLVTLTVLQNGQPVVPGKHEFGTIVRRHAYLSDDGFTSTWSYNDLPDGPITLAFEFEGEEPLRIDELHIFAAPDLMWRSYEHGAILANPTKQPQTFCVQEWFPGQRLRRLHGRTNQDPTTNNGEAVGDELTLPAHDAIFLKAE